MDATSLNALWLLNAVSPTARLLMAVDPPEGAAISVNGQFPRPVDAGPIVDCAEANSLLCRVLRELAAKRETEEELRRSEARFRSIFENAVEGIFQTTPEGSYIRVNPALARIYGFESPEELIEHFKDIKNELYVDPNRRDDFVRVMQEDHEVWDFQSQIYRKDGSVIWITENARAVYDEDGDIDYFEGTVVDITERKEAAEAIRRSEAQYRSFFENSGSASIIIEESGVISLANSEFAVLTGYGKGEIEGKMHYADFFPQSEHERLQHYHRLRRKDPSQAPRNYESTLRVKNSGLKDVHLTVSLIPGTKRSLAAFLDLSELKRTEADLVKQRAYFLELFANSPQAIVLIDVEGHVRDANAAYEELFGRSLQDIKGKLNRDVVVPSELMTEAASFNKLVMSGHVVSRETFRKHSDGRLLPVSVLGFPIAINGALAGVYYIYSDISERKAFEEQLSHQAFHDALTGLPNRVLFQERLGRAVKRAQRRDDYAYAVLMIDLDRFKWVNDSLGHQAGDELLVGIARRLESCVRAVDTVARLGGDEFAILLEEFAHPREVVAIAKRINAVMGTPFLLEGSEIVTTASVGMVVRTKYYDNPEDILRDADIAMYRAKEAGKARYKVFNRKMHKKVVEALQLETDLRQGLAQEQMLLHYQPIVSVENGSLQGFEALVRWNHPVRGLVSPSDFIPVAEETGLIVPLGQWVIVEACRQAQEWRTSYEDSECLTISVNLSARQFQQPDLVEFVSKTLKETGLSPSCLRLEITESAIMRDVSSAIETLRRFRAMGVQLVIDDFGTGYSSLSYLQRFPIDSLKIDRSFISGQNHSAENMEIVRTIISLARNLGLDVVAEGVEQMDQLQCLKEYNCHNAQGFMFSKPVDSAMAAALITKLRKGSDG